MSRVACPLLVVAWLLVWLLRRGGRADPAAHRGSRPWPRRHQRRSLRARGCVAREAADPRARSAPGGSTALAAARRTRAAYPQPRRVSHPGRAGPPRQRPAGPALHQRARQRLRGAQPQRLRELHPEPRRLGPGGGPAGTAREQQRALRLPARARGGAAPCVPSSPTCSRARRTPPRCDWRWPCSGGSPRSAASSATAGCARRLSTC